MKRWVAIVAAGVGVALVFGYGFWRLASAPLEGVQPVDTRIAAFETAGSDKGRGNLLAVQPWMVPSDYANAGTLFAKFDGYFATAKRKGWLNPKTIVVLPEYTGTWLAAADERASVYRDTATGPAMTAIALSHPIAFLHWYFAAPAAADKAKWALFTLKSEHMARDYQAVFGKLARNYGVTIVAGSIVLPEPHVANGRLETIPGGTLYNVSALFAADGKIVTPLVVKAFPIVEEQAFLGAGHVHDIPVFATPAGRLAVLVCADSWYPETYRRIAEEHAELLAIPSYSTEDNSWSAPWPGYDGAPSPRDVSRSDVGKISLRDAWLKYSMGGRAAAAKIGTGVNVFLRGELWDLGTDGETISFRDRQVSHTPDQRAAVLVNQWLE